MEKKSIVMSYDFPDIVTETSYKIFPSVFLFLTFPLADQPTSYNKINITYVYNLHDFEQFLLQWRKISYMHFLVNPRYLYHRIQNSTLHMMTQKFGIRKEMHSKCFHSKDEISLYICVFPKYLNQDTWNTQTHFLFNTLHKFSEWQGFINQPITGSWPKRGAANRWPVTSRLFFQDF